MKDYRKEFEAESGINAISFTDLVGQDELGNDIEHIQFEQSYVEWLESKLEAEQEKNRWVSVDERLPEKVNREYFVLQNNKFIEISYLSYYNTEKRWEADSVYKKVTFWMEIPKLPEVKE